MILGFFSSPRFNFNISTVSQAALFSEHCSLTCRFRQMLNYQSVIIEVWGASVDAQDWLGQKCKVTAVLDSLLPLACCKSVKVPTDENCRTCDSVLLELHNIPKFRQERNGKSFTAKCMHFCGLETIVFMAQISVKEIHITASIATQQWILLLKQAHFSAKDTIFKNNMQRQSCSGN